MKYDILTILEVLMCSQVHSMWVDYLSESLKWSLNYIEYNETNLKLVRKDIDDTLY